MKDSINISLDRVKSSIESINTPTFSTADVLRKYNGNFNSNLNTPASYSFNSQFGKVLKRNESELGIEELHSNQNIPDDNGHNTTSSIWQKRF